MPASIRDVAELAGVSVGTVSNFFNRPDIVSAEAGARVREAIEQLRAHMCMARCGATCRAYF